MTDSWKSEGGQRENRLVDATHDVTNQIISTDPYLNVDDKEGIYFNKEGAPSILGVGTKTPFSRLSFGDYNENNIENDTELSNSLVNNPSIAFTETSAGTNSTGISFYRESSTGTDAEVRGLRFVVNNNETGTLKDTGLVPGVGSINVKNDNTSMLITNDGQYKKVFINSKESQFANTTSGLEVNGDCRITNGLVLKGQQTQLIRSEAGLIFYDENEKTLKYSTGTTGDDIYNLMAQNSSGQILGVSGEYAINFQDYSANVGLVQDISSGGILFAFKDVGFIIGNGDMFKTYSDGTHINESLSGITFGTGTAGSGVGKQNIPALAVIGHNQPGGASANGNVIVSHISDVEPIPIISRTETDMSANGVIYLQNNVTIGVKQPMAVIDVSKIDVPLLRMGSNVHAYYNSVIIGKDISGSSNSFYFGNNIENKASFDSSFNLVFGDDITIENSSSDFEQNLIFGSGITVSKNNNFVFGRDLELPETKDLSFCVLLGKNGQADRGDLIRYFEDGTSVFKLTHGGNMDMLGNMIIRKDISANDASFNNLDVKNIRNADFLAVTDISSGNVTIENKLSVGYVDLSGNSETNPNFGNSKTHPNFALDVSGGLNLTGYADMDDYILKINKTNSVESGKILAGKLDLSHNNLIRASLDASGSILILNNEGEEGLTNLYGRTILQNDLSGNTILTADGNGVSNATKIHMTTFQNNNMQNHFVFDGSGNFGLGLDNPQSKFHLFDGVGYEPNQSVEGIQMGKHNGTGDYNLIINTDEEKKAIIGFSDISNNSNKAHIQYDNLTNILDINSTSNVQINRNNIMMVEINDTGLTIPNGTLDAKFLRIGGSTFDTEASSAWTSTNIKDLSGNKESLFVPFNIGINQKEVTGMNNYQVKFNLDVSGNVRANDLFFGKMYLNMVPKVLTNSSTTIQNNLYGSGSYEIVEEDTGNSDSAWKMFDNDDDTYWSILAAATVNTGIYYNTISNIETDTSFEGRYVEITLPDRWCLKKYGFKSASNNTKMPEQWKVVAKIGLDSGNVEDISNNLWRLVDEKDISDNCWTDQSMNYFPVDTSNFSSDSYRIFRFYFIKTFDGDISQNDIEIGGMEMYGETNKISDISSNLIQTEIQDVSGEKHLSLQPLGGRVGIGTTRPAEHVILDISSTGAIRLPIGDTSERPGVDASGCLRYNDEKNQFEGYGENGWAGLGGVISNNQLITVKADDTNGLTFLTDEGGVSTERMRLDNSGNIGLGTDTSKDRVILDISASGAIRLPMGTDSDRPATVDASGCLRYNTETKQFEGYGDGGWAGLGGVVDKNLDTRIAAEENPNEDKLRFFTGGIEQLVIDVSGNIDVNGVLKVKGFISENRDIIEKTIYGWEGTEIFATAKYGYFDIDHDDGYGVVLGVEEYILPIKAYPGSVLQFNLLDITETTKLVTSTGLDPSGLVFVDNDNNITVGNGSGHTKGTFIWHVPFDAIGNYKLQNTGNNTDNLPIIIAPLNSDLSSNNIVVNHLHGHEINSNQIIMGKDNASNKVILDISANGAIRLPMGTDAERPATVDASGCLRYNTETKQFEGYGDGGWAGLGGVVDKDLDTRIAAEENPDEDKLRFFTGGTEQLVIDSNGNLDVKGVLKVKGFISEHKDIIEKTIYGGLTGTELIVSAKYGLFDVVYGDNEYDVNGYTLPIKAYPGAVLQFNLSDVSVATKIVTDAGLDPSGLVFVDNNNTITSGNGSGYTSGTFIWHVPFDAVGNYKLQNAGNANENHPIIITPLNSDISSNNVVSNNITAVNLNSNNATITTLGSTDINTTNVTATGDIIIGSTNVLSKLNTNANSVSILEPNCLNKIEKKLIYVYVRAKSGENPYNGQGSGSCYYFKTDGNEFESPILQLTPGVTYRFNQEDATNSGHPIKFYETVDKQNEISSTNTPGANEGITEITITNQIKQIMYYQCNNHTFMGNVGYVTASLNLTDISIDQLTVYHIGGNHIETIDLSANDMSGNNVYANKITITGDLSGNNARLHDVSVNRLWIGDIEMIGHVMGNLSNPVSVGTLGGNFVVAGDMSGNDASFNVVDTSQLNISNSSLKLGGGAVPGNIKYESGKFYGYNESKWAGLGGVVSDSERVYVDASDNSGLTFFTSDGVNSVENMRILNDGNVGIGVTSPGERLEVDGNIICNSIIPTSGHNNIMGQTAGNSITSGEHNNIFGNESGKVLTSGYYNNIFGYRAGYKMTTGSHNNIMGYEAGGNGILNTGTGYNNLFGRRAGYQITNGRHNNCFGYFTGLNITSGKHNNIMGYQAGFGITSTGENNIAIGQSSGPTSDFTNTICIGYDATVTGNNMCRIGNGDIKVGIGTSSPGEKLEVSGTIKATSLMYGTTDVSGAINGKASLAGASFTGTVSGISKAMVGLGNVTNESKTTMFASPTFTGTVSAGNVRLFNNSTGNAYFSNATNNTTSNYALRQAGDNKTYLNVRSGGEVHLSIGGSSKAALKSDGDFYFHYNVGIGTTSPSTPLHIYTDDVAAGCFITLEADGTGGSGGNSFSGITFKTNDASPANPSSSEPTYISGKIISGWPDDGSQWTWGKKAFIKFQTPSGTTQTGALVDAMTIQGGNVGIGTDEPTAKLEIKQAPSTDANTSPFLRLMPTDIPTHDPKEYVGLFMGTSTTSNYGFSLSAIKTDSLAANMALDIRCHNNSSSGTSRLLIDEDGNVGIGTSSPRLPLDVATSISPAHADVIDYWNRAGPSADGFFIGDQHETFGTLYQGPIEGSNQGTGGDLDPGESASRYFGQKPISAHFYDYILLSNGGLLISSDERIKCNITEFSDPHSLYMLRDISCVSYNYIDKTKQEESTIGFIAQQVKNILPQAINIERNFIPDQMKRLNASWNGLNMSWIGTDVSYNLLDGSGNIADVSGVKYQFFVKNDLSGNEVRVSAMGNEDGTFTFDNSYNYVFCYGKEVDDFHSLDKSILFTMNFSATQEIDKIQQAEKAKLAAAETKLAAAETEITTLKTQLAAVLARLDALESA